MGFLIMCLVPENMQVVCLKAVEETGYLHLYPVSIYIWHDACCFHASSSEQNIKQEIPPGMAIRVVQ